MTLSHRNIETARPTAEHSLEAVYDVRVGASPQVEYPQIICRRVSISDSISSPTYAFARTAWILLLSRHAG
jgi:hypothetical protein